MSKHNRNPAYSDDDSDDDEEEQQRHSAKNKRTINDLLVAALKEAANPGVGDEEPEVLTDPNTTHDPSKITRSDETEGRQAPGTKAAVEYDTAMEPDSETEAMHVDSEKLTEAAGAPDEDSSVTVRPKATLKERAHFIPLRLTYEERKSLRLVNSAIDVSDYTNAVDVPFKSSTRRRHMQLQHIVAFLTGIIAASNYENGQNVLKDRNFLPYQRALQQVLEIARRYKITNPEKMRSEYGKLVYLMQDAVEDTIHQLLGIHIHRPVQTVYEMLVAGKGQQLLDDPLLPIATQEILAEKGKSRHVIQQEIKRKERAAEQLVKKYMSSRLSADTIRLCMYSISDNNSFLNSNKKPVSDCIALLKEYFSPTIVEPGYSLAIDEGKSGARLSHSHELQYNYVLQSLTLWAAILEDMFRLWYLAEQDLLDGTHPYELKNTGQGLQRVQQSPRVFKAMNDILSQTKAKLGGWVGSTVIHLGDHNVPNALIFIDKYTQVARILGPLITCFNNLETACEENEGLARYLESYGGIEKAKKDVLHDFFTHGFDGSGGDNFFDAGSCIDGRLTSAWNWCSQLANKPFYPLFRLTGFLSFDGQFDN